MATVQRSDLMRMYYAEEKRIKEIADYFTCSEENIRYHLFKIEPVLKRRDRELDQADLLDLAQNFINVAIGDNFEKDLEKVAIVTQVRASKIAPVVRKLWNEAYGDGNEPVEEYLDGSVRPVDDQEEMELGEVSYDDLPEPSFAPYNDQVKVKIYRVDKDLPLPIYGSQGAVCVDLYARTMATVRPGQSQTVPCNIIMQIPEGYGAFVLPRSGLAARGGITVLNSPGTIDRDYCGPTDEVSAIVINHSYGGGSAPLTIERGMRIAQMVILQTPEIVWEELEDPPTGYDRGGFGSTGLM
jgi:dUTP pyrophosphatase